MSRTHGSTGGREAESLHYLRLAALARGKRGGIGEASGIGTGRDIPEVRKTLGEEEGTPSEPVTSRGSTGVVGGSGRTLIDVGTYDPKVQESNQEESGEGDKGITG